MKKATKIILLTSMSLLCIFILLGCAAGTNSEAKMTQQERSPDYSAKVIYGKVFQGGENEVVNDPSQLDTMITDVKIYNESDITEIVFNYGDETISMKAYLLNAKTNNVNNDHYILSPIDISHDTLEHYSISFTTNANIHDLMDVNQSMQGEHVLSMMLKDKHSGDIYYWQGIVSFMNKSGNDTSENIQTNISPTAENYKEIVDKANEQYYFSD